MIDSNISFQLIPSMFADPQIAGRVSLAESQEQLYRCLSVETAQPIAQIRRELLEIRRNLGRWTTIHGIDTLPLSSQRAELELNILSTRMLLERAFRDKAHEQTLLDDARTCCLILLVSYEKHDQDLWNLLQSLRSVTTTTYKGLPHTGISSTATSNNASEMSGFLSLIDAFPIMAFFQLAKKVLWRQRSRDVFVADAENLMDIKILREVHCCFAEANGKTRSDNRISRTERVFGCILELIQQLRKDSVLSPHFQTSMTDVEVPTLDLGAEASQTDPSPGSGVALTESTNTPIMDAMLSFDGAPLGGEREQEAKTHPRPRFLNR